jgi:hypothetical protein
MDKDMQIQQEENHQLKQNMQTMKDEMQMQQEEVRICCLPTLHLLRIRFSLGDCCYVYTWHHHLILVLFYFFLFYFYLF